MPRLFAFMFFSIRSKRMTTSSRGEEIDFLFAEPPESSEACHRSSLQETSTDDSSNQPENPTCLENFPESEVLDKV